MGPRGIALLLPLLALTLGANLFGCGGGAEGPSSVRPDDGVKGIEGLSEDEVDCDGGTPDVESFLVQDEGSGKQVPDGGATKFPSVQVRITLRAPLPRGCVVRVLRNDEPQPRGLTACDRNCTFTDRLPGDGTYEYRVRTEAGGTVNTVGSILGSLSDTYRIALDRVPPVETVSGIVGPNGKAETRDTKPTVSGEVSASLGPGKFVRLQRGSGAEPQSFQVLALLSVKPDRKWSYQEVSPLSLGETASGTYTYRAHVVDAAGNESAGKDLRLTINRSDPYTQTKATITRVNGTEPTDGLAEPSRTRTTNLAGAIDADLKSADDDRQALVVYRDGVRIGEASVTGRSWSLASTDDLPDGNRVFRVRVEKADDPTEFGDSAEVTVPIDTTPPKAPSIYGLSNNRPFQFQAGLPTKFTPSGQTLEEVRFAAGAHVTDPDPRVVVEYTIAKGETLTITRPGAVDTIATEGASSVSFRLAPLLTRPPASPTPTDKPQTLTFRARQIDAAGNLQETTFAFTVATDNCNQKRALASTKPELREHQNWTTVLGAPLCSACHSVSGQYVGIRPTRRGVAETNSLNELNWYWCRKA